MTETITGSHVWAPGMPVTDHSRCIKCGRDGRYHPGDPGCGPEDPAALAEHLDAKHWTFKTIIGHMRHAHGGTYITSRSTKRMEVESHADSHMMMAVDATDFLRRWNDGTITHLREGFGCRLTDHNFANDVDDDWLAEHIGYHETGNDLGGRLI